MGRLCSLALLHSTYFLQERYFLLFQAVGSTRIGKQSLPTTPSRTEDEQQINSHPNQVVNPHFCQNQATQNTII